MYPYNRGRALASTLQFILEIGEQLEKLYHIMGRGSRGQKHDMQIPFVFIVIASVSREASIGSGHLQCIIRTSEPFVAEQCQSSRSLITFQCHWRCCH